MLLRLENSHFRYPGGVEVFKGVNFSVDTGEAVALMGPNGSGKTTLLMIAAGLLDPERGIVLLDGKPLGEQLPEARERIGFMFQNPDDQLFNPTVYDEIAFSLNQICSSVNEVNRRVKEVAEKFGITQLLDRPPYKLSVGEKRIVTLASVVAYNPDVLLLDEPIANVSPKIIEKIKQTIKEFKNAHKAIVIASHDVEFVAETSDRVYIINNGSIIGGSDTRSILSDEGLLAIAEMKPPLVLQILKILKPGLYYYPLTIEQLRRSNGKS
ncbi:ABC transporter ATP-binding protein [Candidatus Bathyarchaeota archaeon]|nr:ABC transporter ATP-binding protein [Candidatus Bathyarchaeota archaeon]